MSTIPQAETEIVSGLITGIVAKGGDKFQVAVQPPGSQYTKNLWTKDENLVQTLQHMIGNNESFLCGVSHWTNNQNQQVRSLWINGVGQGAAAAQPQAPPGAYGGPMTATLPQQVQAQPQAAWAQAQQQQPVAQVRGQDDREQKIHRQTATKVAVDLLKYLSPEHHTFDNLITLSERLCRYYENGVPQQQEQAPPHGDDDVPF